MTDTSSRHQRHARLSGHLGRMEDRELIGRMQNTEASMGIGMCRDIEVDGARVFVKSLPLTREEHAEPYRTHNEFGLPAYYHYGVGSAGFGVFRELAAHVKTTQWVLEGEITAFPLLYHHRILPFRGESIAMTESALEKYVAYWNGSDAIRRYMLARRAAEHHLVLFLEYVPHVLSTWLSENLDRLAMVTGTMDRTLAFLRARGVGHFDAHLGNILCDGHDVFLTDFGLVIDDEFELDTDERMFFRTHRNYDVGAFVHSLYHPVSQLADAWSDDTRRAVCTRYGDMRLSTLLDHLDELADDGLLLLPPAYRDVSRRFRSVWEITDRVFLRPRTGSKLVISYDDDELGSALDRAGGF